MGGAALEGATGRAVRLGQAAGRHCRLCACTLGMCIYVHICAYMCIYVHICAYTSNVAAHAPVHARPTLSMRAARALHTHAGVALQAECTPV